MPRAGGTEMTGLRLGLTSAGHWHAVMHLRAFEAAGVPVALLHDDSGTEASLLPGPRRVPTLEALVAERPDLILVLGPPDEMLRRARTVLDQGIAVGIEKPVGTSPAELEALALHAQDRGVLVSVAQPHLHGELWSALGTGDDPDPVSHFRFRLVNGAPKRYLDLGVPWVLDPAVAGGGVLRNLGLHGVSAFLQLTGGPVEVSSCLLSNRLYHLATEEYAAVHLLAGGVIGQVEVGYTLGMDDASEFEMTVHRQHRSVRDDGRTLTVLDRSTGQKTVTPCLPLERRYEQFARVTLEALRGAQARVHTLEHHLEAMTIIDRCYRVGHWVSP